jgi:hypothetical protein
LVAANLLSPVPALGGVCIGSVFATGRVNAAFGVLGAAITALAANVYFHNTHAEFGDALYLGGAQFLAMAGWTVFVVMSVFVLGERFHQGTFRTTLKDVELGRALRAAAAERERAGKSKASP